MLECLEQAEEELQVRGHLLDHAEDGGWTAHRQFLLLGQHHGWHLHRQVGEQDHVLYRDRFRTSDLTPFCDNEIRGEIKGGLS